MVKQTRRAEGSRRNYMGLAVADGRCPICNKFMNKDPSYRWKAKYTCGDCDLILYDRSRLDNRVRARY